jgi:hypothetical protein
VRGKGAGRPRKGKETRKLIENSDASIRTRVMEHDEPDGVPSDEDYNPGDADENGDVEAVLETPWRWSQWKDVAEGFPKKIARLKQAVQQDVPETFLDYLPFMLVILLLQLALPRYFFL